VAVPLAVVVALKEPHGEAAQATDQVTPAPLLTVAVIEAVAPVVRELGCPLRVTVTEGGGGVELLPPQAVRKSVNAAAIAVRERLRRKFIVHLRAGPENAPGQIGGRWMGGSEIRECCEPQSFGRRRQAAGPADSFVR
jgi:hypothetical protein